MAPPTRKKVAVRSFRELIAWQKAMLLVERTYTATAAFPDTEKLWTNQPDETGRSLDCK